MPDSKLFNEPCSKEGLRVLVALSRPPGLGLSSSTRMRHLMRRKGGMGAGTAPLPTGMLERRSGLLLMLCIFICCIDFTSGFRILTYTEGNKSYTYPSGEYFVPYDKGIVGIYGDPATYKRERVNEGSQESPDQPLLFEGPAPRQVCPGMIGPFSDGNFYCTAREFGYCDRRSGTCFCNIGYSGIDCSDCTGSHFKEGNLCYPKKLCPNDCSNNGVCNFWTGQCDCFAHRVGMEIVGNATDCSQLLCKTYSPLCEACNENVCNLCAPGYYLTGDAQVCSSCYDFDPRCSGCTKEEGCTVCSDPLLTSVRRSGYRASDRELPVEENTRELSITIPFGSKDPNAFADSEAYFVVSQPPVYLKDNATRCDQGLFDDDRWSCETVFATHKVCGHKGVFGFKYPNYTVFENETAIRMSVYRTGGGYGDITIGYFLSHYTTDDSDVTATARYTSVQQLSFEHGVIERSFLVTILDDNIAEEDEVFQLVLEVPEGGGSVNAQFRANVTIRDDDIYKLSPALTHMAFNASHSYAGDQFSNEIRAVLGTGELMTEGSERFFSFIENDRRSWNTEVQRQTRRNVLTVGDNNDGTYTVTGSVKEQGMYQARVFHCLPNGLRGDYYRDGFFEDLSLSRIDRFVKFTWGTGRLMPRGSDYVSIRWTGMVEALWENTYFKVHADDHARLWVDGKLILDHWHEQEAYREPARTLPYLLTPGNMYEIVLEYREVNEDAYITLLWGSTAEDMSASASWDQGSNELHVHSVINGTLDIGEMIEGDGLAADTYIQEQLFGSGYDSISIVGNWSEHSTILEVIDVLEGTLAVGQTLNGVGIEPGTKISRQLSSSLKLTASWEDTGALLNVSAISAGIVSVGQQVVGDGIPQGTTILSQVSGDPGGVGIYELSEDRGAVFNATFYRETMIVEHIFLGALQAGQTLANLSDWGFLPCTIIAQTAGTVLGGVGNYSLSVPGVRPGVGQGVPEGWFDGIRTPRPMSAAGSKGQDEVLMAMGGVGTYSISTSTEAAGSEVPIEVGGGVGTYRLSAASATASTVGGVGIRSSLVAIPPEQLYSIYEIDISPFMVNITSAPTDASTTQCTGEGLFNGVANYLSEFEICPRDSFRNLRDDDDEFKLASELFDARATLVDRSVHEGDGSEEVQALVQYNSHTHCFVCSYTPQAAGVYRLDVTYQSTTNVNNELVAAIGSWTQGGDLTVASVSEGSISLGQVLYGSGLAPETHVTARAFTARGSTTSGSEILKITQVSGGSIAVGQEISGTGIPGGSTITMQHMGYEGVYHLSKQFSTGVITVTTVASAVVDASWRGNLLYISKVISGKILVGQSVSGGGLTTCQIEAQLSGLRGSTGTYRVSEETAPASFLFTAQSAQVVADWSADSAELRVTSVLFGALGTKLGFLEKVEGTGIAADTFISKQLTSNVHFTGTWVRNTPTLIVDSVSADSGGIYAGQTLHGSDIEADTIVTMQISGEEGGAGTYLLSRVQSSGGSGVSLSSLGGTGIYLMTKTQTASGSATITAEAGSVVGSWTEHSSVLTVSEVISGRVAAGQKLVDNAHGKTVTILRAISGVGGVGTYVTSDIITIDSVQRLTMASSASFSASINDYTMTVITAGADPILPGQSVSGAGVPSDTTIIAQTTGGVGRYQMSNTATGTSGDIAVTSTLTGAGGAGTYSISAQMSSGDSVSLYSKAPVAGSPFEVQVAPAEAFGPYSQVVGLGSDVMDAEAGKCYNFSVVTRDTSRNLRLVGGDDISVYMYRVDHSSAALGVLPSENGQPSPSPTARPSTSAQAVGLETFSQPSDSYTVVRYGIVTDLGTGTYSLELCPVIAGLHEVHVLLNGDGVSNQPEWIMERVLSKNAHTMGSGSYRGQYIDSSPYSMMVKASDPSSVTTTAKGPGLVEATVGVAQTFTVTVRDSWNNVLKDLGDGVVTASILQSPQASPEIWNFLNGTVRVKYVAELTGLNDIAVYVNGKHIDGSPFKVPFADGVVSNHSYALGPGLETGVAGKVSFFEIIAFDLDANRKTNSDDEFMFTVMGNPTTNTPLANVEYPNGTLGFVPVNITGYVSPCPVSADVAALGHSCTESLGELGHYYGVFTPTLRGDITVRVYVGTTTEFELTGSPHQVYIHPAKPMAERTVVYGPLYEWEAGVEGTVELQLRDVFLNHQEVGARGVELALLCVANEWGTVDLLSNYNNPSPSNLAQWPGMWHYQGFFAGLPRVYGSCADLNEGQYACKYNARTAGMYVLRVAIEEPGLNATYFNSTDFGHLVDYDFEKHMVNSDERNGFHVNSDGSTIHWTGDISGHQGDSGNRFFGSYLNHFKSRVESNVDFNLEEPFITPPSWRVRTETLVDAREGQEGISSDVFNEVRSAETATAFPNENTILPLGYNQSKFRQEYWSVRWTGRIQPTAVEEFIFSVDTDSDSLVRLYIGGVGFNTNSSLEGGERQLVLSSNSSNKVSGRYTFTDALPRDFSFEYSHRRGPSHLSLSWQSPSQKKEVIPSSAFTHWRNATHTNLTITPAPLCPHCSTAFGPALTTAVAGRLESFMIYARDSFGNLRQTGGEVPSARAVGVDGVMFRGRVTDFGNSSYLVEYNPTVAGRFLLYLTVGCCPPHPNVGYNREIQEITPLLVTGLPFELTVHPAVIDVSRSVLTGPGTLGGVAGEVQTFQILYRDLYNNPTTDTRTYVFPNGSLGMPFGSSDIVVRFFKALDAFNGTSGDEVLPSHLFVTLGTDRATVEYVMQKSGNFDLEVQIRGNRVVGYPREVNDTVIFNTTESHADTRVLGSPYSIIVYPAKADASRTVCRGVGLRSASNSSSVNFEITLHDTYGNQLLVGGNKFYIRLLGDAESHLNPAVLSDPAVPICQDMLNGKYMCSYTPASSGPHELHIQLLNYSTTQPGGLGLSGAYYSGLSLGAAPVSDPQVTMRVDPGPLSFGWTNGYALAPTDRINARKRMAGQFVRWDGYIMAPRTDTFSLTIEAARMSTTLYIDKVLVWDSDAAYQAEITMELGASYEVVLEVKIEGRHAHAGELSLKVFWETPSYKKMVIPGFFLYDSAQHVAFSPFAVSVV